MQLIECPYCGPREEVEFHYGGQAHVSYPDDPASLSDEKWAEYLFVRDNTRGPFAERWVHALGCRRWFNAIRDTVSYRFEATYRFHRVYRLDEQKSAMS
jgi:sarcosine oxidase subunit delta